jgi:hypothetical protein
MGKIKLIVLDNVICESGLCLIGRENESFYADFNHLSKFGVHLVTNEIIKHI